MRNWIVCYLRSRLQKLSFLTKANRSAWQGHRPGSQHHPARLISLAVIPHASFHPIRLAHWWTTKDKHSWRLVVADSHDLDRFCIVCRRNSHGPLTLVKGVHTQSHLSFTYSVNYGHCLMGFFSPSRFYWIQCRGNSKTRGDKTIGNCSSTVF